MSPAHSPVRAKKALSQNFLTCPHMALKLVNSLAPHLENVVEAGPGTGALTSVLLDGNAQVTAVEIDKACIQHISHKFEGRQNLHIVDGSILDYDFFVHPTVAPVSFLSNLPYGITTPVILHLMNSRYPFPKIVVTMQKEVAQRLCAAPGTKLYGRLSVMIALYGRIRKLFDLPPTVFNPAPSVTSTAVEIIPEQDKWLSEAEWSSVVQFVKAAFCQRRKKLSNSLASGLGIVKAEVEKTLNDNGFDPSLRAEKISPLDFVAMARCFEPANMS